MTNEFRKYMHVERFGNDEVQGIELGSCYIFPKIDGTNASVWVDDAGNLKAGSRNREVSLDEDNAGFLDHISGSEEVLKFLSSYPHLRLYGEWLVPHTIRTYRESAWRKFYVFDVYDNDSDEYLAYDEYSANLDYFGVDYLSPLSIIKNASYDNLIRELDKNDYLINDGSGTGEGIVIKNYQFKNGFNRTVWAKIVTTVFKEGHKKAMGVDVISGEKMVEAEIAERYVDASLVNKVYAKIANDSDGWNSKYIPRLLSTVFYDLVNEEIWNIVKKMKNPTIDFKKLHQLTIIQIKSLRPDIF